jgi:hypothetical protein
MLLKSEVQNNSIQALHGAINIEKLFELAIETANQSYKLKAMEIAREALIFAKQSNAYLAVYIHGFLAVLNIDFNKTSTARIHLYNAINRLDKTHYSYASDYKYLQALMNKLNKVEDTVSLVAEPIAA